MPNGGATVAFIIIVIVIIVIAAFAIKERIYDNPLGDSNLKPSKNVTPPNSGQTISSATNGTGT